MADLISHERRSWNMSRIRSRDTSPELRVRSVLHRMGVRFRIHAANLPGRPDVVLPRYEIVVFVHGCFWHRHPNCRYAYTPKSNLRFWIKKFAENRDRDCRTRAAFRGLKWRVVVVWECELADEEKLRRRLARLLQSGS